MEKKLENVRTIVGEVQAYAREIREKKTDKGMIYSRGVKILYVEPLDGKAEGWHNLSAFGSKPAFDSLEQLPDAFPKGSIVRFGERQNKGYWNFMDGTFELHEGPENKKPVVEVQLKVEEETVKNPILKLDMNTSILRQVFLKVAVQAVTKNTGLIKDATDVMITPKSVIMFAQGLEREWLEWEAKR